MTQVGGPEVTLEAQVQAAARTLGPESIPSTEVYLRKLDRVAEILRYVHEGRKNARAVALEHFSTSDFKYLFSDVLYRMLLGGYELRTNSYESFFDRHILPDYRVGHIFRRDGLRSEIPEHHELEAPQEDSMVDGRYTIQMKEYMRAVKISFQTFVNDDLSSLTRVPTDLAAALRYTESLQASRVYLDSGGWKDGTDGFFWDGTGTAPTSHEESKGIYDGAPEGIENVLKANTALGTPINAPLTPSGLQAAKTQLRKQRGYDGEPIMIDGMMLVLGTGLYEVANSLLRASSVQSERVGGQQGSGTLAGFERITHNTAAQGVTLIEDPNIHILVTSEAIGDKMWMLVASPSSGRPAFAYARLQGFEQPFLYKDAPRYEHVGGGVVGMDPLFSGYLCGMYFGTTTIDPRFVIVSTGAGA
jgi:hypothetical protein